MSAAADSPGADAGFNFIASTAIAVVAGGLLALAARSGAVELLVAVAVVQTLLAFGYVFAFGVPGWLGALIIAGTAAAGADVASSVWPHGRLGTLLAVFGLAVPVMFVHQLWRGAARVRLLESLGAIALLVAAEVALTALLQLRHDFETTTGADVASGVAVVGGAALSAGYLIDLVMAVPRLDPDVPRGLVAVLGSAVVGAAAGQLILRGSIQFADGRGLFAGALLGVVVGLFAIAVAYLESSVPRAEAGFTRRARPAVGVLASLCFLAPAAFLLCSAIRA